MRRVLFGTAFLVAAVGAIWWVYSANQVAIGFEPIDRAGEIHVVEGEAALVIIEIDPARRSDAATVTLDGQAVPHPHGQTPGTLVWSADELEGGVHILEVEVPRPTWFPASARVSVVVTPAGE